MKINEGVPDFCVSEIYYTSPLINSFRFKDSAPLSKWRGQVQLDYRSDERGAVEFVPRRHREHTDTLSIQFTIDELRPTIDSTFRFYSPGRGESFRLFYSTHQTSPHGERLVLLDYRSDERGEVEFEKETMV